MKHIKRYSIFNEDLSQEKLDDILDKISKFGLDSLTPEEQKKLNDHSFGIKDPKDDVIYSINNIIEGKFNGFVTISELGLEHSPVLKYDVGETHLIEEFDVDYCTVVVYTVDGEYINSYSEVYEEMDIDILQKILNVFINV